MAKAKKVQKQQDHIEVFKGKGRSNCWYWRIRASNRHILLTSQGYTRKSSAWASAYAFRCRHHEFTIVAGE